MEQQSTSVPQYYEYKNECVGNFNNFLQDFVITKQTTHLVNTTNPKLCTICEHSEGGSSNKECMHVTHDMLNQHIEHPPPEQHQIQQTPVPPMHHEMHMQQDQLMLSQEHPVLTATDVLPVLNANTSRKNANSVKDETPVTCTICNTVLKNKKGLKMHQQIHDGIKKFLCDLCPKSFLRSNQLKSHKKVHTGEHNLFCFSLSLNYKLFI